MTTPVGNNAANASGNGPAAGYTLNLIVLLFMLIFVINMNTYTLGHSLFKVMKILLIYTFNYGIKLCPKLPIFLTWNRSACKSDKINTQRDRTNTYLIRFINTCLIRFVGLTPNIYRIRRSASTKTFLYSGES